MEASRGRGSVQCPSPRPMGHSILAFRELLELGPSKASSAVVLRTRIFGNPADRHCAERMAAHLARNAGAKRATHRTRIDPERGARQCDSNDQRRRLVEIRSEARV